MYPTVLILHSWLRWLVILAGLWALAAWRAQWRLAERNSGRPHPGEAERDAVSPARVARASGRAGLVFTIALDVQLLLGVLLYVALSPITRAAMTDVGAAMRNALLRFWTVEHPAVMILAVVFGHIGRMAGRRRADGKAQLVWYALAVLALLAATPWPFLSHGRPLFRW